MNKNLPLNELSIYEVFNGHKDVTYEIPIYQRNYAWEKDEIEALVRDVWDAREKSCFYIGTLVTFQKGDTYEVIDGQQRLTTLFLLLKSLGMDVKNKLTYRARNRATMTLKAIDKNEDLTSPDLDSGIQKGYNEAKQAIEEIVGSGGKKKFKDYLLYNVHIIHYNVPRDVDLNHYFEVMNSRGEQLEKHEIVKAKLMYDLNGDEKNKFAAIWQACSDMDTYIQTKKGLESFFDNNLKDFRYMDASFESLPEIKEASLEPSSLMSLIHIKEYEKDSNVIDEDNQNSLFQPIIDFPNFLLIVLKITRMKEEGFNPEKFILDDKELINEFDEKTQKSDFAKHFCFNLLKAKYLLDNYVVHHSKEEDTYEHNPWQLRYWNREEKAHSKNLSSDNAQQDKMVHLLSMFEVSFTPRQRKNYLFYVLCHLFENRDLGAYCSFLENLAKKYFYDIYLQPDYLNEINTPKPGAFDQTIIKDGKINVDFTNQATAADFYRIYGDGSVKTKGIPLFVFNYIDYRLWEKYANNLAGEKSKEGSKEREKFFGDLGCSDFGLEVFNRFYFSRTRRSLEHYYPQANINIGINEDQINCLGNFAMIGSEANSSGSNWSPHTKLDHYLDSSNKVRLVSVASLKFRIMMQICFDNYGKRKSDEEWIFEDIQTHQNLMLKIILQ